MSEDLTVLIADDHPLFRKGVADLLKAEGDIRIVAEAGDGETALALLERHKPAIAIMDLDMPKMNGLKVAEAAQTRGIPTKLILLTGYAEPDLLKRALELGVLGYVLKENAVGDIVACVRLVAEGRSYISPTASHLLRPLLLDRQQTTAAAASVSAELASLSKAELEVLRRVAKSLTTKEIASELGISPKTVENHRSHICHKLGLTGTNALVRFALERRAALA
jgi:DNA-binding NarL/FixJ family response regulator